MKRRDFNKYMAAAVAGLMAGTGIAKAATEPDRLAKDGCPGKDKGDKDCCEKDKCKSADGKDSCKGSECCKDKGKDGKPADCCDKDKAKDSCKGADSKDKCSADKCSADGCPSKDD
jgi:hypothetical protein